MKKSVLIAIQPYWVFLIIAKTMGWNVAVEKTVEVRKNFPKDENWDKTVKIYCSKDKKSFNRIPKEYQPEMEKFLGKVVGMFVCDEIISAEYGNYVTTFYESAYLDSYDLLEYSRGKTLYGWSISNLMVYKRPKKLNELRLYDVRAYYDEELKLPMPTHEIKRPPQSWCYIQGVA